MIGMPRSSTFLAANTPYNSFVHYAKQAKEENLSFALY
jgi:hypothetical protein